MNEWKKKTVEQEDFFTFSEVKEKTQTADGLPQPQKQQEKAPVTSLSAETDGLLEEVQQLARECKFSFLEKELCKIRTSSVRTAFTIAVIGEFSRGKSTLINHLLGAKEDVLPTGTLPTTALLTTVMYHETPELVHIGRDNRKETFALNEAAWEPFVAGGTHDNTVDVMQVGIPNAWLRETGIHLLDTPGAGDLNGDRAHLVIDALMCSDGAIIVVSALAAMSLSEKLFIEQNLAAKKMPRTILIVSKLDEVKEEQRAVVMSFILEMLKTWHFPIPVLVPQSDLAIPNLPEGVRIGYDAIREVLNEWVEKTDREWLLRYQVLAQLSDVADAAIQATQTQLELAAATEEQQREEGSRKRTLLEASRMKWEDCRIEMQRRAGGCRDWLAQTVREKQTAIVEKLAFDLSHTNNPKSWWEQDYPYRLKIEMTVLAGTLESNLNQYIVTDVKWLNDTVSGMFQHTIPVKKMIMMDKETFQDIQVKENPSLPNLSKARITSRVVTGVATVLGYVLFGPFGSIISVGGGVLSDVLLSNSIETQKELLKHEIEKEIPQAIDSAIAISEGRIQELYAQAINESTRQEDIWMKAQLEAIDQAMQKRQPDDMRTWENRLAQWCGLKNKITEG